MGYPQFLLTIHTLFVFIVVTDQAPPFCPFSPCPDHPPCPRIRRTSSSLQQNRFFIHKAPPQLSLRDQHPKGVTRSSISCSTFCSQDENCRGYYYNEFNGECYIGHELTFSDMPHSSDPLDALTFYLKIVSCREGFREVRNPDGGAVYCLAFCDVGNGGISHEAAAAACGNNGASLYKVTENEGRSIIDRFLPDEGIHRGWWIDTDIDPSSNSLEDYGKENKFMGRDQLPGQEKWCPILFGDQPPGPPNSKVQWRLCASKHPYFCHFLTTNDFQAPMKLSSD